MRYLRLLSNALVTGLVGAAYLTVLFLQINPHLPLATPVVGEWYLALSLFYGFHLAIACYLLMMLSEVLGFPVSAPAWISVRLQAWMVGLTCAGAALLTWLNLRAFHVTIGDDAAQRMAAGALGTSGVALVLIALAIVYYSVGRRGSAAAAAVLLLSMAASVALPLAARGAGELRLAVRSAEEGSAAPGDDGAGEWAVPGPPGRVVLVLLEGASLEYLWPRAVEGRFPNLGRVLDRGAAIDLATLRPTQPEPVWTAAATGKYPPKNGLPGSRTYHVRSRAPAVELLPDYCLAHALVRFGIVRSEPQTSAAWRARPLWDILGAHGIRSGVVRWAATYPARPMRGFLISDRVHHASTSLLRLTDEAVAYPAEVLPPALAAFSTAAPVAELAPLPLGSTDAGPDAPEDQPTRWDRTYGRLARELGAARQPQFLAVRYTGIDAVGHAYLRYAVPRAFGNVPGDEVQRYGGVLDRYYSLLDEEIGAALALLGPEDLLLVMSGFGMEPVTLPKRLLARVLGDPHMSGTHERAPDGFLLAYGAAVRSGKLQRGAIVDLTPTILYFLGLPVGRDMDGFARADLFVREFTDNRPIVFIPSYER